MNGCAPGTVLPQLVGMPMAAAQALVVHAGLKVRPVENRYSNAPADTADQGTVLEQVPLAGYRVEPGMIVTFRVAR